MSSELRDPLNVFATLDLPEGPTTYVRLAALEEAGIVPSLDRLPVSIRVLLENAVRHLGSGYVTEEHVRQIAGWTPETSGSDVPFMPSRVVLQDFTGVPAVVDLAAMREGIAAFGGDPARINPVVPADLVIDHSVQVDYFGTSYAFEKNVEREFERNRERYTLLRWGQKAFKNFSVVPPGTGIVHQVNLEYLASVVHRREENGVWMSYPDTLVGTDSHTTMVNGLGVLGWGVGGIEAEAVLLGQPYYMLLPEVVGLKLTGALPEGATATDLVLTVTQLLRKHGVVGRFVEFYGAGLSSLSLPDRATLANMAPEYGATAGFFPVDEGTLAYLRGTGRDELLIERVEKVSKAQGMFRTDATPDPDYTSRIELDLSTVVPSVAGPRRPQDRIDLTDVKDAFDRDLEGLIPAGFTLPKPNGEHRTAEDWAGEGGRALPMAMLTRPEISVRGNRRICTIAEGDREMEICDGTIVIAAITSCTNTSNPSVMVGAGLLAKNAVERGIDVKPWVKTSMAPGSKVVSDYLEAAGLLSYMEALRFQIVGYGCTTCIGNSGPLAEPIEEAITEHGLVVASALSGNRNFEARIHPLVRANYLMSPVLVVAFALAGRIDINLDEEPLGTDPNGEPVFLRDIWPTPQEVRETIEKALKPEMYRDRYAEVFDGDELWQALPVPDDAQLYGWDDDSTYIQNPPFFEGMKLEVEAPEDIVGARVLARLGGSVTTDHISPAGAIPRQEPAARYLQSKGVEPRDFNTFGSRRGNHEVMMRGTFGNIRMRNLLLDEKEGGYTLHFPTGEIIPIYDAAMRYQEEGTPLIILTGTEYGSGSSRDWAAKGTSLLGVKAVIAESYERIHRSNLVGMGVLPLEFREGETPTTLGLSGRESFSIYGIASARPGQLLQVVATKQDGTTVTFHAIARLDSEVEVEYYRNGGILHTVLRKMARGEM